jgi:hypothetical protein
LHIDDSRRPIPPSALGPLTALPHLGALTIDAHDASMPYIAEMPALQALLCQDTDATDDGFIALSASRSLQMIWGRRCYGLGDRGFTAMARMPQLRALSVSLKHVSSETLALLPLFPALRELMPMDMPDADFAHVGKCTHLESLILMYCRDTGDVATEHLASLTSLRRYFVSYNQITDRTPALLAGLPSLEELTFSGCAQVTDVGIRALTALPSLRLLRLDGMHGVTSDVARYFGPATFVVV